MSTDPRVDAYIAKARDFARPMLERLRGQAHAVCPEADEAIKWGVPALVWKGKNLCGFAAFKEHVAFFVQGESSDVEKDGMGEFGKMRSMADLPSKAALTKILKARMKVIEAGPSAKQKKSPKPTLDVPPDLAAALKKSRPAAKTFEAFSASNRRDYIEWITEAKQEATRTRRLAQAIEWMAEGKPRNWKYMK